MELKLTVYAADRIISGTCVKTQTTKPNGTPDYGSVGSNEGRELEARFGLEIPLDSTIIADPAALDRAVKYWQEYATRKMREHQAAIAAAAPTPAPAPTGQATATPKAATPPGPVATWGHPSAAPAAAPAQKRAPVKPAPAPEPEDESQDEDEGPPPRTGAQLLAWARKQEPDAKDRVYAWARKKGIKRAVDMAEKYVSACYTDIRNALKAEQ
jgi:hypothetical protein